MSSFTYVLSTLFLYFILSLLTYTILAVKLWPDYGKAYFIAYEVATGADPFNFANELKHFPLLWLWILVFHVATWLVVPVLAATAVDAAYRAFEERRSRAERRLRRRIREIGEKRLGLSGEALDNFEDVEYEKMKWQD